MLDERQPWSRIMAAELIEYAFCFGLRYASEIYTTTTLHVNLALTPSTPELQAQSGPYVELNYSIGRSAIVFLGLLGRT
jgi:hypothetical protein